jgi:hypothetical protein
MGLEQSIYELTVAVNKLTMTLEKYNQNSNADLSPVTTPVIKMASEIIMEPEPVPTIKVVKPKPTPIVTADKTVTNIVEQPAVTLDVLEMRDTIRTMCSELSQSDKKNKAGIEAIFANYKATHLRMVDDATVPALYAELMTFKGSL